MLKKIIFSSFLILSTNAFSIDGGYSGSCKEEDLGKPCNGVKLCANGGGTYQNAGDLDGDGKADCACRCSELTSSTKKNKISKKTKNLKN